MDRGTGRIANATFADYLIPVNADVRELDVVFVGEPDRFNSTGTKGSARSIVPAGAPGELRLDARKPDIIPDYPY